MRPHRGDVWLIDFGDPVGREQAGIRPAVVVSADLLNDGPAGVVVVVPLTTAARGLPSHVEISAEQSGLDEVSYAKGEDVKSALSILRRYSKSAGCSASCSTSSRAPPALAPADSSARPTDHRADAVCAE